MSESDPHRVTKLVHRLQEGDAAAAEELLPLIYGELRTIANALFARQHKGHTLQPTALVHEAWLKLAGSGQNWETRKHFFAVAARAMRQVLCDYARAQRTDRRGAGSHKVTLCEQVAQQRDHDLVDIDDALQRLAAANERHARVVELRMFAGLTIDEVAGVLGVTSRTVDMDWRSARAFLSHALRDHRS